MKRFYSYDNIQLYIGKIKGNKMVFPKKLKNNILEEGYLEDDILSMNAVFGEIGVSFTLKNQFTIVEDDSCVRHCRDMVATLKELTGINFVSSERIFNHYLKGTYNKTITKNEESNSYEFEFSADKSDLHSIDDYRFFINKNHKDDYCIIIKFRNNIYILSRDFVKDYDSLLITCFKYRSKVVDNKPVIREDGYFISVDSECREHVHFSDVGVRSLFIYADQLYIKTQKNVAIRLRDKKTLHKVLSSCKEELLSDLNEASIDYRYKSLVIQTKYDIDNIYVKLLPDEIDIRKY